MSIKRSSDAKWEGSIKEGKGNIRLGSGAFEGPYSFNSRFGDDTVATNPEELIAAAHAGCYTMAFSGFLGRGGYEATSIETKAVVHLEKEGEGFVIPKIDLIMNASVPNISNEEFQQIAKTAKEKCPVSRVLAGAEITLFEATETQPGELGKAVTNKSGRFEITSPTDTSSSIFFVTANLGNGVEFVTILGPDLPPSTTINELTTVAAAWSMAQFYRTGVIAGDGLALQLAADFEDGAAANGANGTGRIGRVRRIGPRRVRRHIVVTRIHKPSPGLRPPSPKERGNFLRTATTGRGFDWASQTPAPPTISGCSCHSTGRRRRAHSTAGRNPSPCGRR